MTPLIMRRSRFTFRRCHSRLSIIACGVNVPASSSHEYVPSVIAGTSGAPAKYPVLIPFLLKKVTERTKAEPFTVFRLFERFFITASLGVTHRHLRWWLGLVASLGGTPGLAAFSLPLPTRGPTPTFSGVAVLYRRMPGGRFTTEWLFGLILLLGMFNRATTGSLASCWRFTG